MLYDVVVDKLIIEHEVDADTAFMWVEALPEAELIEIFDDGRRRPSRQKLGL